MEDDPDVREVAAAYLEELGHDYIACADGASGLAELSRNPTINVVMADFAMPGMTGLDIAQKLREQRSEVPVLLVTGHADLIERPAGVEVLHKPFRRDDLGAALMRLAHRETAAAEPDELAV